MSKNRTQPRASSQRGTGRSRAQNPTKAAPAKKTAGSRRYDERQEQRRQVAVEARRARNRRWGLLSIGLVIVVVSALVIVKVAGSGGTNSGGNEASPPAGTAIPAATLAKIASVPMSILAAAPSGGLINQIQSSGGGHALTSNGKPELLFIGAEFCPHCAAERWALYVALSKFGTFSPSPGRIHSATQDGNVPTLTFYGTTYSDPYFVFDPVEVYTNKPGSNGYTTLQTPTKAQSAIWQSIGGGSFPFVDFAGKATLVGAQYSYAPLQNLSFSSVAAQVGNNSTVIGADIDASAFQLVKSICHSLSSNEPATVCSASGN
jgi:hypothetical protein